MAREVLELQIIVSGAGSAAADLTRIERSASAVTGALRFMRNALVALSFARITSGVVDVIDSFQRMQNQLRFATGDIKDAASAFIQVSQIAQETRSPLEAVSTLFQRLTRVGSAMGLTYQQVSDVTKTVSQSFQIAGASADETKNAIIQLTQGLALGALRGQDLRSVIEFNPVIAQIFADKLNSLGLSVDKYGKKFQLAGGQVYAFVTAHRNILTSKIAVEALLESAKKMDEVFQAVPPTIGQMGTAFKNAFSLITGTLLTSSGLLAGFGRLMRGIIDNLGAIIGVAAAVAEAFTAWLVLDLITAQFAKLFALRGIFGFILAPVRNIAIGFAGLYGVVSPLIGIFGGLTKAVYSFAATAFLVAKAADPFKALYGVLNKIKVFKLAFTGVEFVQKSFQSLVLGIERGFVEAGLAVSRFVSVGVPAVSRFVSSIVSGVADSARAVLNLARIIVVELIEQALIRAIQYGGAFSGILLRAVYPIAGIAAGFRQLVTLSGSLFGAFRNLIGVMVTFVSEAVLAGSIAVWGVLFNALPKALGQVESLLVSVIGALAKLGTTIVSAVAGVAVQAFAAVLALIPLLLVAVEGLVLGFGALVALGGPLLSLAGVFDGISAATLNWHDILNGLIRFAVVSFDLIANHLPLVFNFLNEQWHNAIAKMVSVLPDIFAALKAYLVEPILGLIESLANLAPLLGALAGAAAGGPAGAAAGFLAGVGANLATKKFSDGIRSQFEALGASADDLARKSALTTSTYYTDQFFATLKEEFASHQGDYLTALNLLGKGVDPKTVVEKTGVAFADIPTLQSQADFLAKLVPQHGQLADIGTDKKDKTEQRTAALLSYIRQVSPYAAAQAKIEDLTRRETEARAEGINVEELYAKAGLTHNEILNRLSREVLGVGNATTDYNERLRLSNELEAAGTISLQQMLDANRNSRITFLDSADAVRDLGAGYEAAILKQQKFMDDVNHIGQEVVAPILKAADAQETFQIQTDALNLALAENPKLLGLVTQALGEVRAASLSVGTDLSSGFDEADQRIKNMLNDVHKIGFDVETNAREADTALKKLAVTLDAIKAAPGLTPQQKFDAGLQANIEALSKQRDLLSGVKLAVAQAADAFGNEAAIARDVTTQALSQRAALELLGVQTRALKVDMDLGIITGKEYARTLRDLQITALSSQTDTNSGFVSGMLKVQQEFSNTAVLAEKTVVDMFQGMEDALVKFGETGKLSFGDLVKSIKSDLIRLEVRKNITGPLANFLGFGEGQSSGGSPLTDILGSVFGGGKAALPTAVLGGSASNPMYVRIVSLGGSPLGDGHSFSGSFGSSGFLPGESGGVPDSVWKVFGGASKGSAGVPGGLLSAFQSGGLIGGATNLLAQGANYIDLLAGGAGLGGGGPGLLADLAGLFGFAEGGSFTVGGDSGATDSQLVAFRATRGERVNVETPDQQNGKNSRSDRAYGLGNITYVLPGVTNGDEFKRTTHQTHSQAAAAFNRAASR